MRKLYALVDKEIDPDNAESVCNQEILLPGHVFTAVFKDKVQEWLGSLKYALNKMSTTAKFKTMSNGSFRFVAQAKIHRMC
jgi:DNA-directed RNA polymerase I subunit RPA2